jgi:vacuolar-type H+-ATPase subunit F/Vma7
VVKISKIIIIGSYDFTIGFQLTGIKDIIKIKENINIKKLEKIFTDITENPESGIIVTDDITIQKLTREFRKKIEGLVKPIVIILSLDEKHDNLREMIRSSLGIDLSVFN